MPGWHWQAEPCRLSEPEALSQLSHSGRWPRHGHSTTTTCDVCSSSIQLIQAGYEPRNYFYDSSQRRCYFTRACRKEEVINTFNKISFVHGTTNLKEVEASIDCRQKCKPKVMVWRPEITAGGCIFLKISSADAEKRRGKTKKYHR